MNYPTSEIFFSFASFFIADHSLQPAERERHSQFWEASLIYGHERLNKSILDNKWLLCYRIISPVINVASKNNCNIRFNALFDLWHRKSRLILKLWSQLKAATDRFVACSVAAGILASPDDFWRSQAGCRALAMPGRCPMSISRRSPSDFRSKVGEIGELFRAPFRQGPTDDPPIPERSPTGHRLILKKLPGGRPVIGGAPKYAFELAAK